MSAMLCSLYRNAFAAGGNNFIRLPRKMPHEGICSSARIRKTILAFVLMAVTLCVRAAENVEVETDKAPSNSIEVRHYRGGGLSIKAYFEKEVVKDLVAHLIASKARGFESLIIGSAYYLTPDMEVGLGFGSSRYAAANDDKRAHGTLSGFWYWKTNQVQALVYLERYRRDPAPWYYYSYAQKRIIGDFSAGIYGETRVGWGPRVNWSLNKNIDLWAAVPINNRSDISAVIGIEIAF